MQNIYSNKENICVCIHPSIFFLKLDHITEIEHCDFYQNILIWYLHIYISYFLDKIV